MKNNRITSKEQIVFFNKLDIITLDSIFVLYTLQKEDAPNSFYKVYQKKWEEKAQELEGCNEHPYESMIENFNLTEIIETKEELSDKELKYIRKLVSESINAINPKDIEFILIPKLIEYFKICEKENLTRIEESIKKYIKTR